MSKHKYFSNISRGLFISFVLLLLNSSNSFSESYPVHKQHFTNVLEGLKGGELRNLYKEISSRMMDNAPMIPGFKCANHRWFGHWGFEGAIPFNLPPLKNCLDKLLPKEKARVKNMIREKWLERVKEIEKLAINVTGLPPKQAKAFAGLIYNTHLLGDWRPGNKVLEPLPHPESISRNMTKNLRRLLGNNSKFVREIERDIAKIKLPKNPSEAQLQEYAETVLDVLKKYDIGKKICEVYSAQLAEKGIVYKIIGQGLKAVSKLLPTVLAGSYTALYTKTKPSLLKSSLKMGAIAAIFSGLGHSWQVVHGREKVSNALLGVTKDSTLTTSSVYVADGIIQRLGGGKYALSAIIEEGVSESVKRIGAMINYGVITFVFDETHNIYHYTTGTITSKQFFQESGKYLAKASASGAAAYCTVALGAGPGGFVVMAITIGTYTAVNYGFSYADKLNKRNYLFVEDVLGKLPLEMQNRITPWDREYRINPWDRAERIAPWDQPSKQTPWNKPQNVTPWD